ncbi:LOG family protein [Dictyobacter formicarum]|uniref:Cytokinin riboside 5'-monophosphate phosphoribohydrolase n=1 Tax=Dictyobacter formicarum TaxID=2778368 RepID=A0ABQ3VQJ6_9CHLR|nr:TIGR00730 family Rossman fold protein [Dictyobacter formicarum]GHO88145.1 hypothetical protein KSZ_61510 [Dictyobacter formicarum]GHO88265.1 hypothetical protein KSZ_62710 [Dictyobacter formicarum]
MKIIALLRRMRLIHRQAPRFRICVFAGAQSGNNIAYQACARELGRELARHRIGLVYGGARDGMMGLVADNILAHGGEAIGVVPTGLWLPEENHAHLTRLYRVGSMAARKTLMARLADGFVVLPGGQGTLDEFFEFSCLDGLSSAMQKPIVILNVNNFFSPLLHFLNHIHEEGFTSRPLSKNTTVQTSVTEALEHIATRVQAAGVPRVA